MKEVCAKREHQLHTYNTRQLIFDDRHRALYCFVPKVGCTTWKATLVSLRYGQQYGRVKNEDGTIHNHLVLTQQGMVMLHLTDNTAAAHIIENDNITKFVFVRHPIERLVSAYRDKFESRHDRFHKRYGRKILKMFRTNATKKELSRGSDVTFPEFIQYVLGGNNNPHWSTYIDGCCLCQLNYDYIGKFETFTNDSIHVLNEVFNMTLWEAANFLPAFHVNPSGRTDSTYFDHYISQLSTDDVSKLNAHFKWDFQMFDYKPLK